MSRHAFQQTAWTALALGLVFASPHASRAQDAGLTLFEGEWNGSGTLQRQSGVTERIRCQARYQSPSATRLRQTLQCRSDASTFALVGNLTLNGRDLTGDWTETTRNARGSFRGRVASGSIQGQVEGTGFSAAVNIRTAGNRQTVGIKAAATEMTSLDMVLTRSGR